MFIELAKMVKPIEMNTRKDQNNYNYIIMRSNAHREGNNPLGRLEQMRSPKSQNYC